MWNKQKDETMKTQTYKVTTRNEVLTIEEYAAFIYIKERDCQYPPPSGFLTQLTVVD